MKYRAIFLKRLGKSNYKKIGEKGFKPTDETVRFKEHTFIIPKNVDSYSTNKNSYVFFDFDNSKILNFVKTDMGIDSKMLDKIICQNIIGKLISTLRTSMEEPNKWKIFPFIVIFIIGAVLGYLMGTNPAFIGG